MPKKTKFNQRKLMERAIDVMTETEHEPRKDSKVVPLVGAVIFKPDGTVETAYRGEIRDGDHAEFTLLEKKNRSNRLDNSILFTTLEPCAPGSRGDTKLSCAERIVLARIKEVWIGIEDPDPNVDRRGIQYLQDNDVKIHMFDRDLQEKIREENKDFIDQAKKRAAEVGQEKIPKKMLLSKFDDVLGSTNIKDLSTDALEQYRSQTEISDPVGSPQFNNRLLQLGILVEKNKKCIPSGFGYLVFGNQPRNIIPQAGLIATIHYPNGEEETKEFNNPLVLIPALVIEWLKNKLPNLTDRSNITRKDLPTFPVEIVREAVVNALIHRDYNITGAKCQLIVTEQTITIKSPGAPLPPITLEQMQAFNAPMLSRNPKIHFIFHQMELAEEAGLGLKTFKTAAEKYGLPLPKYTFEEPYLVLTLFRSMESAVATLPPEILAFLNKDERAALQLLTSKNSITIPEYIKITGFNRRKAQRHFKKFIELDLIRRSGAGRSTHYQIVR